MTFGFADVQALEILDSRGRPTVAVTVELPDGDAARFGGGGVLTAVGDVKKVRFPV